MTNQRGAVLITSLVMLVVLTLLVVTAINMSTINLRIVGNMQSQIEAESAVQNVIEMMINDLSNFNSETNIDVWMNVDGSISADAESASYVINRVANCVMDSPAEGYEAQYTIGPGAGMRFNTDWIIRAETTSGGAGEHVDITQGVRVLEVLTGCP